MPHGLSICVSVCNSLVLFCSSLYMSLCVLLCVSSGMCVVMYMYIVCVSNFRFLSVCLCVCVSVCVVACFDVRVILCVHVCFCLCLCVSLCVILRERAFVFFRIVCSISYV